MKKALRITLKSLGIFILVILLVLFTAPYLFKGKLVKMAKNIINENVEATVDFDASISLFRHFPNISLTLEKLSVVGVGKFEGDTLAAVKSLNVSVNIWSYLKGGVIDINSITIDNPLVQAKVLADGSANWDIAKSDSTAQPEAEVADTSASSFKLTLKKFEISNGYVSYDDESSGLFAALDNINTKLTGDLSATQTTLDFFTSLDKLIVLGANGKPMLPEWGVAITSKIDADLEHSIYKFAGAEVDIDKMELTADGQVAMVGDKGQNMNIDLTYAFKVPSLASLLAAIPAEYMQGVGVETQGEFDMKGWVRGIYSETSMPVIGLDLQVKNGYIKYAGFPEAIKSLNIDLQASLDQNNDVNSKVALNKMHLEIAGNPFDASTVVLMPFTDPDIKANVNGKIDFASLKSAMPLPDSLSLNGVATANIAFAGLMSQIEKEEYDKLQLNGALGLTGFSVKTADFPQEIKISKMDMDFSPAKVALKSFDAAIGSSDVHLVGSLENFLNYLFKDQVIRGNLQLTSNLFNCNEMMASGSTPETAEQQPESASTGVFVVPSNIDFNMKANINRLVYDKMDMTNVGGNITIKDGKLNLNNLVMNAMGGNMTLSGDYFAPDPTKAVTDLSMKISSVEIKKLVESIGFIDSLLPIAKNMAGNVTLNIDLSAPLNSDMAPDISKLNATGSFNTKNISFISSETLNTFTSLLKLGEKSNELKDVNLNFAIKNGMVQVPPFSVNLGNVPMKVGGEHGLTSMNYHTDVSIPTGKVGTQASEQLNGLLSQAGITNASLNLSSVPIGVDITGSMKSPKFSLGKAKFGGTDGQQQATPTVQEQAKDIVNQQVDKYKQQADTLIQQKKDEATNKLKEALKKKLPF